MSKHLTEAAINSLPEKYRETAWRIYRLEMRQEADPITESLLCDLAEANDALRMLSVLMGQQLVNAAQVDWELYVRAKAANQLEAEA